MYPAQSAQVISLQFLSFMLVLFTMTGRVQKLLEIKTPLYTDLAIVQEED